jgi:hypothetical protein
MPRPRCLAPLLLVAFGCRNPKQVVAPAPVTLKVSAASDFQAALPVLAE